MNFPAIHPGVNAPTYVSLQSPVVIDSGSDAHPMLPKQPSKLPSQSPTNRPTATMLADRLLRTSKTNGLARLDRATYQALHEVKVAELKDLPPPAQAQLLSTMAELFSEEWGEEDTRYKTVESTFDELKKQMNSADPYDAIIVSFKRESENGQDKYKLVTTASMARRDNPKFDNLYLDDNNVPRRKHGDGWLMNVYTPEQYRRKGHAAHVIGEVAAIAEQRKADGKLPDFNGFHLYTQPKNVGYYQKLGFGIVSREYIPHEDEDEKTQPHIAARSEEDNTQLTEFVMRYPPPQLHRLMPADTPNEVVKTAQEESSEQPLALEKDLPSLPYVKIPDEYLAKDLPPPPEDKQNA
jgi:ribosomal protein S18 acetylase RimI-like enzyme